MKKNKLCILLLLKIFCSLAAEIQPAERIFEIGADVCASALNNYFSFNDIFKKTITVDFGNMADSLAESGKFALGANASSRIFMRLNLPRFRFYVGAGFAASSSLAVPQSLVKAVGQGISSNQNIHGALGSGADLFFYAETAVSVKKGLFLFTVSPAVFAPVVHIEHPAASFKYINRADGRLSAEAEVSAAVYSRTDVLHLGFDSLRIQEILSGFGADFSLSAEMAVLPCFDAGISLENIPAFPAKMKYKTSYTKKFTADVNGNFLSGIIDGEKISDMFVFKEKGNSDSAVTIEEKNVIFRQLKFRLSGAFRPFENRRLFTVIPSVVFKLNRCGALTIGAFQSGVFDFSVKALFRPVYFFTAMSSVGYTDKIWQIQAGTAFDFRVFELDLAAALCSQDLKRCFELCGAQAAVGIRFGY
ncbi:MAG: hypothetical protein NC041_02320 [Bacteroides sp.]|nr:hypothetical protein [Prevotella sp.]MCM1407562.1 hypothetical protein [Treponema brennaborense]MCM1469288.1 hypothetical protein [Bacteroides sp.]